ncbi:hypothetical protein F4809DRAFT_473859 [Biscogniauxia mediterranea]|nr:hypothetical protein F4809DRAFT_473859 [Biscogniauxia mediterranea]
MAHHHVVVPRTTEVIPGASVNIVLKADQRTGRQVRGIVRDVLTRGDHHRGIKVRLTDGRIGRVQSMAPATSSASSSDSTATSDSPISPLDPQSSRGGRQRPPYRDVRLDEPLDVAPAQIDLGAYIVPPKRKGKGRKGNQTQTDHDQAESLTSSDHASRDLTTAAVTCPVCGAFEGDEAAVAHHVAAHFE